MAKFQTKESLARVECEIVFTNILFPRNESLLKAGTWVSAKGKIIGIIEGREELRNLGIISSTSEGAGTNISIRGNICAFDTAYDLGKPFKIVADIIDDARFGIQFDIFFISSLEKIESHDDQYKFLSTVLSSSQIDLLYKALDNPFKAIEEGNVEALTKVKGIGIKKAYAIIDKFNRGIDNSKAYIELYDLGLTKNRIDKLVEQFGSPNILVDVIRDNPYRLIELTSGFGWESADALALNSGVPPLSEKRIEAYIFFFLESMGYGTLDAKYEYYNGSTWIEFMELFNIIIEKFPELHPDNEPNILIECIKRMLKKKDEENEKEKPRLKMVKVPTGAYDDRGREITYKKLALYKFWELEQNIANELFRIQSGELLDYENPTIAIQGTEILQGFEFTDEQREGIYTVLKNQVSIITGRAGCVDKDTEFFNGEEWKKISEYKQGDKVLQYNEDGTANLVTPLNYIKQPQEYLWHFKTKYGLDQCLSDEHNVVYITSKGNLYQKTMREVVECHNNSIGGFSGKFMTTFNYSGKGINLTDAEIKLMLAVICDGNFREWNTNWCRINLKKEKKKIELEKILNECSIPYKKNKWNSKDREYDNYSFYAPVKTKVFDKFWYKCSQRQLKIIADNILQWDGSISNGRKSFSTTVKENADFVQWVFSNCGYRASISFNDRRGQDHYTHGKKYKRLSLEYNVQITDKKLVSMGGFHKNNISKTPITKYKTLDGYEYCFTVPSHMLVLRRNNKIFVSGNCGKSTVVSGMLAALPNYHIELSSPTGQAASRLSSIAKADGKTIHRLLQYVPGQGFMRNEHHPLEADIVILDEVSMCDLALFYALLKSIPTGTKLVMVGDYGQLPSIGLGNLFKDIIESQSIPVITLTKIHRQSAKSGIITEALKVSDGVQLTKRGELGNDIRGELQDFKLITYTDSADSQDHILNEFKRLYYEEKVPIEDIQIIVPLRKRGTLSINHLNPIIQEMVNPDTLENYENTVEIVEARNKKGDIESSYKLKNGDKVRINNNTYRGVFDTDGEKLEVFNGNLGMVEDIDLLTEEIRLDLGYVGKAVVPQALWNIISLSYVSSCHSSQGSEFPYVIVGLDYSAYTLLNRNWLYTAITRSKKYCVLVAQDTALRYAINQSATDNKRTFLKEMLIELKQEQEERLEREAEDY